jgi:chemotaxis signal transduction protein
MIRDLIIFEYNGRHYGIDNYNIKDIIEPVSVTPLPYSPPSIDGLINVKSEIVMQINFGKKIGFPQKESRNIIIIKNKECFYGLAVEKIVFKVTVDEEKIDTQACAEQQFFEGIFTYDDGTSIVLIDVLAIGAEDHLVDVPHTFQDEGFLGVDFMRHDRDMHHEREEEQSCLLVQTGDEYFGFALDDIYEILEIETLRSIPRAPSEILGYYILRDQVVLTLSLSQLLGVACGDEATGVVVYLNGKRVLIALEGLIGIYNYPKKDVQVPVRDDGDFSGWLKDDQERMIGLINTSSFYTRLQQINGDVFLVDSADKDDTFEDVQRQKILSFWVGSERCALPIDRVSRVSDRGEITQLPEDPTHSTHKLISGVTQIQGVVIPTIDLQFVLHHKQTDPAKGQLLIVEHNAASWALIIDKVDRVIDIDERDIQSSQASSVHFVSAVGKVDNELISILSLDPLNYAERATT